MKKLIPALALSAVLASPAIAKVPNLPDIPPADYNSPEDVRIIVGGCTAAAAAAIAAGPVAAVGWLICIIIADQAVRRGVELP